MICPKPITLYICRVMSKNPDQAVATRRRHRRRLVLLAVVIIVALPVLAAAVLIASFNPNSYAPQIIAAVERATGRQLTIGGPITLRLSLSPVIEARSLSLANPPGFPDANFVTLDRVDAQLALLPLLSHHLDILHLHLVGPDMVLERNAAGIPDWILAPPAPVAPPTPSAAAPASAPPARGPRYKIALQEVDISNGQLTIKNKNGTPVIISVPSLSGTAAALDAPLHLKASAQIGATPFTLAGTVGPVARLSGIGTGPWPVDLTVTLGGATAHVHGTIAHPLAFKGYDATVTADIPALNSLAASLPSAWIGRSGAAAGAEPDRFGPHRRPEFPHPRDRRSGPQSRRRRSLGPAPGAATAKPATSRWPRSTSRCR